MISQITSRLAGWLAVCLLLRAISVHAESTVTVVQNGKSSWRIAAVSKGAPMQFAAQELQRYLGQMSHCKLPVDGKLTRKPSIVIGLRDDLSAADKALLPVPGEGYDGYAVAVLKRGSKPDRIIIAGNSQCGTIYGAYDFLEHLGCRWFYPTQNTNDPEVVPRLETISIATNSWAVASPLEHRICNGSDWFFDMPLPQAIQQLDWAMKNRFNMMGWQAESSMTNHSLLWQYKRLGDVGILRELEKRGMTIHG